MFPGSFSFTPEGQVTELKRLPVMRILVLPVLKGVVLLFGLVDKTTTLVTEGIRAKFAVVKENVEGKGLSAFTFSLKSFNVTETLSPVVAKSVGGFIVQVSLVLLLVDHAQTREFWAPEVFPETFTVPELVFIVALNVRTILAFAKTPVAPLAGVDVYVGAPFTAPGVAGIFLKSVL